MTGLTTGDDVERLADAPKRDSNIFLLFSGGLHLAFLATANYREKTCRCSRSMRAALCRPRALGPVRIWRPNIQFARRKHDSSKEDGEAILDTDPRLKDLGLVIKDDFAALRDRYAAPKHPVVLAHGLMGFNELRLAGPWLPGVQYWRGIREALEGAGVKVITTSVPTTGSISDRAEALHEQIRDQGHGEDVNIIAHSMGGLDARRLISRIQPTEFKVKSLTTIATPHRGSSAADMLFRDIGLDNVNQICKILNRLKVDTGAFSQLTRGYMNETFNPVTPNDPQVRYFSYGAAATPHILSVFRLSHDLMDVIEGPNDGLVSVSSSHWGEYKGTLMGVTHLDLINWTNRFKRLAANMALLRPDFNAIAFYLGVVDMLAKEGL